MTNCNFEFVECGFPQSARTVGNETGDISLNGILGILCAEDLLDEIKWKSLLVGVVRGKIRRGPHLSHPLGCVGVRAAG